MVALFDEITIDDFNRVDVRVGTVVAAEPFPETRHPALIVHVDFGPDVGVLKTSAQITHHYAPETLPGRRVLGVVNLPARQIGKVRSQFLLLGFRDENNGILLADFDQLAASPRTVANGERLC